MLSCSIRARLLGLVVATIVPFSILIGAGLWNQWHSESAAANQRALNEARLIAAQVDDHIGNLESLMVGLSRAVSTNPADVKANNAILRQAKSELPDFVNQIVLSSLDGHSIGTSFAADGVSIYSGNYPHFRKIIAGERLSIGEAVRGRTSGDWIINVSRPIEDQDGRLRGVLTVGTLLKHFHGALRLDTLPTDSVIRIVDENRIVIAQSLNGPNWVGRNLSNMDSVTRHIAAREISEIVHWSDGIERITGSTTAHRAPWLVTVGLPNNIAFAAIASRLSWGALFSLMAFGSAFTIAWMLSGRIVRPIQQLGKDAAVLAAGELGHRSAIRTKDEIGDLATGFNQMAESLERRREEANRSSDEIREAKDALAREKSHLNTALNNMNHGLCMFDAQGHIVLFNGRYATMMGQSSEYLLGLSLLELFKHRKSTGAFLGDPDEFFERILKNVREGKTITNEMVRVDGTTLRVIDQPMEGGGWVATYEDVTEQRRAERDRDRNRAFLDLIIGNVPSAIFVKNAVDRKYVLVNSAGERFWKISRQTMIGKTADEVFPPVEAERIAARDNELLQSGQALFDEREILTPCDGVRSISSRRLIIRDEADGAQYVLGVIDDVTERKAAEAEISRLAHYDSLTNLPNRALFREQLEKELSFVRRGGQLAVLYLDLDHFKSINDTLGHPAGDELLKGVAERLRSCLRESDLIARLGGDEFAIVQTGLQDPTDAEVLARRLRESVTAVAYDLNGHQTTTDLSIGIALAPGDGTEIDELIKHADLALYGAKAEGRANYRYFEPEMNARMKHRRGLEIDLRSALSNGEFEIYYQPVVNLKSGAITGCEALLRWRHPIRGTVPPLEFIPVAEETGLIHAIGDWVLKQACVEAMKWPKHIKIAVNISPVQLRNSVLALTVADTLAASGLFAQRLELEVTESVLMQNNEVTLATLHQIKDLGVRISMDDFGTGYSSLSCLRIFPFDKIKIDRSFVSDLTKGDDAGAIVQAILDLARSLKMTTTAEGVETAEQWQLLELIGCNEMQGYVFSPPRPANEIVELLAFCGRPIKVA